MNTIKNAYNTLEHLMVILHRIKKNARYNYQDKYMWFCAYTVGSDIAYSYVEI
jgi:hypothetical protein